MIFQDPMTSLNPTFKIGGQITETLERHFDMSKGAARQRAIELLEEVGIPGAAERLDDYPHQFSGGMRQPRDDRDRALVRSKLLIADEPTTALDVTIQAQILDLLEGLREEHRMAMIIITHDMGVIAEAADDVAVMYAGQIVEQAGALDSSTIPSTRTRRRCSAPCRSSRGHPRGSADRDRRRPPDLVNPPKAAASRRGAPTRDRTPARRGHRSCARSGPDTGCAPPIPRASAAELARR